MKKYYKKAEFYPSIYWINPLQLSRKIIKKFEKRKKNIYSLWTDSITAKKLLVSLTELQR